MSEVRVRYSELIRFVTDIFSSSGMSARDAGTMAEVILWANERGIDSHGVVRIPSYLAGIKTGKFNPKAKPVIRPLLPATFAMDCNRAAGPVCMMLAASHAIEVAQKLGVATGLLSDPTHVGAVGRYAQWIAERGYAAIVIVAGIPLMAYHGAKVASLATSPIAIGVPATEPEGCPMVLDMATSGMAAGRLRQAAMAGKPIPDGLAIDANGVVTTDASRATTMLPMGGPKGSGLSLMFECLTGILAGTPILAGMAGTGDASVPFQNSLMIVLDVSSFRALDTYRQDIKRLQDHIKALPRQDGFDELLLPGERGDREVERRRRDGIPLNERLVRELLNLGKQLSVAEFKIC